MTSSTPADPGAKPPEIPVWSGDQPSVTEVAPQRPSRASAPASRSGRASAVIVVVAALFGVAGIAFAAGRLTAPAASAAAATGFQGGGGTGGFGNGPRASGAVGGLGRQGGLAAIEGTVASIDGSSLSLTLANGQTIQIALDATTAYHRQQAASASDVTPGTKVLVQLNAAAGGPRPSGAPGSGPNASGQPGGFRLGSARDITIVAP